MSTLTLPATAPPRALPADFPARLPPRPVVYPESDGEPMAETEIHIRAMLALIATLTERYREQPEAYVIGNMFLYYEEGDPTARVAPDVMVVFGVPKRQRRIYRLWEEGRAPSVVFEITSRKTRLEDLGSKKLLYAEMGVAEYFLFDPEGEYLRPPLQGFRLEGGDYRPIAPGAGGALSSAELALTLLPEAGYLQLADAATGERLLRPDEAYQARRQAQAEIARLRAELERLRLAGQDRTV
ncbi:MAG: Uma2 family endonuclease [Chloroflexi bacterium]|nr:Uma2 family endonuclease [Chloroflexota bacterium]